MQQYTLPILALYQIRAFMHVWGKAIYTMELQGCVLTCNKPPHYTQLVVGGSILYHAGGCIKEAAPVRS